MEPLAAIILVNYNGEKDTIECLESLSHVAYKNFFTIVVDNASSEHSVEVLRKCQGKYSFELYESENNMGFSAGNNIGIRTALAKGAEFVILLNNDTIVEPDFLTKLIRVFQADERCGLSTGTIYYESNRRKIWYAGGIFNSGNFKTVMRGYGKEDYSFPSAPECISFASGCCMCIKAEAVQSIGYLDETFFMYEEDTEFCFRLLANGWKIYYEPRAVIYHKVSASTGCSEKASPLTQYYMVRNRYKFIRARAEGLNKVRAYFYSFAMYSFYCLKGYMDWKYVFLGLWDFSKGIQGKSDRKF